MATRRDRGNGIQGGNNHAGGDLGDHSGRTTPAPSPLAKGGLQGGMVKSSQQSDGEGPVRSRFARLARAGVAVLLIGVAAGGLALLLTPTKRSKVEAFESMDDCVGHWPVPGFPGKSEAGMQISTYSSVNLRNGNTVTQIPIVGWSGVGPNMDLRLFHNSSAACPHTTTPPCEAFDDTTTALGFNLGPGWSMSYSDHLIFNQIPNPTSITLVRSDGRRYTRSWWPHLTWQTPEGSKLTQDSEDDTVWRLTHRDWSFHEFKHSLGNDSIARLVRIVDAAGVSAQVTYGTTFINGSPVTRVRFIKAGNREIELLYNQDDSSATYGFLDQVFDPRDEPGQPWDGDPRDRYWTFHYDAQGRLERVENAMQSEPGRPRSCEFNPSVACERRSDCIGFGGGVCMTKGYENEFSYDSNGLLVTVSETYDTLIPESQAPRVYYTYEYDSHGKLTRIIDPSGLGGDLEQALSYSCHAGLSQAFLWTDYTDRRGSIWTYRHVSATAIVAPSSLDDLDRVFLPDGAMEVFKFDPNKNLKDYTDGSGNRWFATYDSMDNFVQLKDPLNHIQSWTYDGHNNATSYTDAAGNTIRFYYDHSAPVASSVCEMSDGIVMINCNTCSGGTFSGESCTDDDDCPGGSCALNDSLCRFCDDSDPEYLGLECLDHSDCGFGACDFGTCGVNMLPPPARTLLTRIVEPTGAANPPPDQAPGEEGEFPVTRMIYHVPTDPGSVCTAIGGAPGHYDCRGQLKAVIDPNGVWTTFEYDQWGQPRKYAEGIELIDGPAVIASDSLPFVSVSNCGSTGPVQSGGTSGGGGGGTGHDTMGRPKFSGCLLWATAPAQCARTWEPIKLPTAAPGLPALRASFDDVEYSPRSEVLDISYYLTDPLGAGTRTHRAAFDVIGRQRQAEVETTEAGTPSVQRSFGYFHDIAAGTISRFGPDGVATFVELDPVGRVASVRRGPESNPLMQVVYTYTGVGDVETASYYHNNPSLGWFPGGVVEYVYEGHRLTSIIHRDLAGLLLRLDYEYLDNDVPWRITEYGAAWVQTAQTTYGYDRRGRLTSETRTGSTPYQATYIYDAGGNRTGKTFQSGTKAIEVDYHYDVSNPTLYGSNNNRLMKYETFDVSWGPRQLVSTTYYDYVKNPAVDLSAACRTDGNVTRIITDKVSGGGMYLMSGGGAEEMLSSAASEESLGSETMAASEEGVAGGGPSLLIGGMCGPGQREITAVRFGYAFNGQSVTIVHDERWCAWNANNQPVSGTYAIHWGREFRYDSARARYLARTLDGPSLMAGDVVPTSEVWTDYDGDGAYRDWWMVGGSPSTTHAAIEPGVWRSPDGSVGQGMYLHNDHLGTQRGRTNAEGYDVSGQRPVFTAFGERLDAGTFERHGYVGAWGYQAHSIPAPDGSNAFPFLHVGARYYDPATGRFLQRDPIGIDGGVNVYVYTRNTATAFIDPSGLFPDQVRIPEQPGLKLRPIEHASSLYNPQTPAVMAELAALGYVWGPHVTQRMVQRGITPDRVANAITCAIRSGTTYWDPKNQAISYISNGITAASNASSGWITTVIGTGRVPGRLVPIWFPPGIVLH